MQIHRLLYPQLVQSLQPGKVVILYGPRRIGKTTLLSQLLADTKLKSKQFIGDNLYDAAAFSTPDIRSLRETVADAKLIVIDEAQKIKDIGLSLKIIADQMPHIAVVASGSASFDLAQHAEKELVGRNKNLALYPVSFAELCQHLGRFEAKLQLGRWMIWGGYPEVVLENDPSKRKSYLDTLIGSYLYRDILELTGIRKSKIITNLLQLLAFQIGKEVSWTELARNLKISLDTVSRYLDLLEKSFIIFNVRGFSRNLRKEISKNSRYYFWDNGVRNALINNFNPLNMRNDVGQLWENFLAMERLKYMAYTSHRANVYFWRTYDQKEIDWIEESGGKISGFEFKYSDSRIRPSIVNNFLSAYHGAQLITITKDNFESFVAR